MKITSSAFVSVIAFAFACMCAPSPANAWHPDSHRLAARIITAYFPRNLKSTATKYQSQYFQGVEAEPELYDFIIEKNGEFLQKQFLQAGNQRLLYHLQRMQALMAAKNYGDALAYELGQFTRCAADLLEPLPSGKQFDALEISGSRIFFTADFAKKNAKFDFMYDGRTIIQNFPATIDAIVKLDQSAAAKIYKIYHSKRNYNAVSNEAETAFNRALNFISDSMFTMDNLVNAPQGRILDMHSVLGLDKFNKEEDNKIGGPKPPEPPKQPAPPKKKKENK